MRWKSAVVIAALTSAALFAPATPVRAQAVQTSTLTGTIKDGTGAVLPGVTVNASSPSQVGGVQTSVTDSQGVYRFPALRPGIYELEASLSGFKSVKRGEVTLTLGTTTTIDVTLSVASVSETVQVLGETPVVDIKSSASNTQLSEAVLQNLPTGRFQPDIINLTPGVASNVAYGGAQSSNALLMDGVDVSDPEGGTPWSFFNYNWVEQIQVVALGANAEYGGFTGVAANSIIRSGSNKVNGLFEYLTERKNWVADNTTSLSPALQKTFTPREIKSYWDTTGQVGFPIVKDKLFMFTGVQYFNREDRPAGYTGDFTTEKDPRTINKLTWAVSPNIRAEGFIEYDQYNIHGRGANATHPTADVTAIELSPEWNWNGQITWTIDSKTMLNVRNGGYTGYFPIEPTPPASRSGPYPHVDGLTGIHTANIVSFGQFDRNRNVTAATLTRYADHFAGKSHEFKFGFEFERSKIRNESGYPGGRYYYDYGGAPYQVYLWNGYVTNATAKRTTLYAQDTWTLTDRLTANLGLRLDVNRGSVPTGTVLSNHALAPRAGMAFDVTGDHQTVLRANWGRYYDALFGGQFEFMDLSQQSTHITAAVLGPNQFQELTRQTPSTNVGIDPNIRQSYADQFLAGVERQLFPNFSLTAQYINRRFRDFMGFIDTGSVYVPVQKVDPGPDGRSGTADDGQTLTVYNLTNPGKEFKLFTNPDNAYRDYNAFQLIGAKRYSNNWQASLSYTWSRTQGTVNNIGGSNAGGTTNFQSPGQTGTFTDPNHFINADGPNTFDYTNQVKLDGTYRVPAFGGFNISAVYRYTTGLAWGRTATIRGLSQGNETVRIEPRGTRRTDPINNLDFRAEKTFPVGADRRIGVYLDIFNINNQGVIDNGQRTGVIEGSGSTFGNPNFWISPRLARLGFRFTF
jgi:Carboxypeptidase regulatory-like domain/TonB dependent receptor-like, beta-barrel